MSMALGMKPLHQHLGVEISGLRLDAAIDDETVASLWQVLDEHSLLVIREHPLADDDLLGLSRRMGRPDGGVRRYRSQGPAAPTATPSRWHSHGEIKATGPALLCVSSLNECPTEGGEIEFAAVRAAYDAGQRVFGENYVQVGCAEGEGWRATEFWGRPQPLQGG